MRLKWSIILTNITFINLKIFFLWIMLWNSLHCHFITINRKLPAEISILYFLRKDLRGFVHQFLILNHEQTLLILYYIIFNFIIENLRLLDELVWIFYSACWLRWSLLTIAWNLYVLLILICENHVFMDLWLWIFWLSGFLKIFCSDEIIFFDTFPVEIIVVLVVNWWMVLL